MYKFDIISIHREYHYLSAKSFRRSYANSSEEDTSGIVDLTGHGYYIGLVVDF